MNRRGSPDREQRWQGECECDDRVARSSFSTGADPLPASVLVAVSSLAAGGAERTACELSNAWAGVGRRVGVVTFSRAASDHYCLDKSVVRIGLNLLWDSRDIRDSIASNFRRTRMLRAAIRSFDPDVIVSLGDQTNVRVLVAAIGLGVPVIVSERIDPRRHPIGRAWAIARRLLYPLAAAVVVQTEAVAGWARRFVSARKVHVIPNFVRRLPVQDTVRVPGLVLAVGRLDVQKGFDILLKAFARCCSDTPYSRLKILGEGPQRDALQQLGRELGVDDRVEFPGVVRSPEQWMARASLFVLPSRYEGFPNVLLEAMAMGCPVIATDCDSGPREIIRPDIDGVLVPPDDVVALARAIAWLFSDVEMRRRLGAMATGVRERFSTNLVLASWEKVISESCNN